MYSFDVFFCGGVTYRCCSMVCTKQPTQTFGGLRVEGCMYSWKGRLSSPVAGSLLPTPYAMTTPPRRPAISFGAKIPATMYVHTVVRVLLECFTLPSWLWLYVEYTIRLLLRSRLHFYNVLTRWRLVIPESEEWIPQNSDCRTSWSIVGRCQRAGPVKEVDPF